MANGTTFLWGAASAAYQVEGAWQAQGKGLSNWDVYTNVYRVTEPVCGKQETGNVAINAYDRAQYLEDIALMKSLGLTAYRFSMAWTRLLPDGVGRINEAGVAHYQRFVDDLIEAGIEPMVTLFHWDMPQALEDRGGWLSRDSIDWFRNYARVVREALGDRVSKFITFNEPFIDLFLIEPMVENVKGGMGSPFAITEAQYVPPVRGDASLDDRERADDRRLSCGRLCRQIGLALPLMPMIPQTADSADDIAAAAIGDAVINRWCLDAMFKGRYPDEIMAAFGPRNPDFVVIEADFAVLAANRPDFVGVNFYAPAYVRQRCRRCRSAFAGTTPIRIPHRRRSMAQSGRNICRRCWSAFATNMAIRRSTSPRTAPDSAIRMR